MYVIVNMAITMYTTPSRLSNSSFVVVPSAEQSKALCTLLPVHPCMVVELYMAVLPTQQPQHCYAYTLADRLPHWTTKQQALPVTPAAATPVLVGVGKAAGVDVATEVGTWSGPVQRE